MWIFTPFGMLFVSAVDQDDDMIFEWELQVRARDRRALQYFKRTYMGALQSGPIIATPKRDYEFRFHTYKHDFGLAMEAVIDDIREPKFKPTTLRKGMGGRRLHTLYTQIWYVIARHYESPILGGKETKRNA